MIYIYIYKYDMLIYIYIYVVCTSSDVANENPSTQQPSQTDGVSVLWDDYKADLLSLVESCRFPAATLVTSLLSDQLLFWRLRFVRFTPVKSRASGQSINAASQGLGKCHEMHLKYLEMMYLERYVA